MAVFYGEVKGSSGTVASRGGNKKSGIRAAAQSYDGSVIAIIRYNDDGELRFCIDLAQGSSMYGDGRLPSFYGTFDELQECFANYAEVQKAREGGNL